MRSLIADIDAIDEIEVFGRVKTVQGLLIEVVGPVRELRVGGRVFIESQNGTASANHRVPRRPGALPASGGRGHKAGLQAVFAGHDGAVYPDSCWAA